MTIVMWIRVHPYKSTHFENRKTIFHFIAFMVCNLLLRDLASLRLDLG